MKSIPFQWIDVSVGINAGIPVWPGDPAPVISTLATHEAGDGYMLSEAFFGLHTGTHIDAPLHFIPDGKSITEIDLDKLIGIVRILDATACTIINSDWLSEKNIHPGERLFFKTISDSQNGKVDYHADFTSLDESAARYLAGKKISLAGIDGLSIARRDGLREVHVCLLQEEIVIVENLCLNGISEGSYEMICLPVRIEGAEAAPARVLLKRIP